MNKKIFAGSIGSIVVMLSYILFNIIGINNKSFKDAIAITVVGQNIPYFGRVVYSLILGLIAALIVFYAIKNRRLRDNTLIDWILVLGSLLAIILSFIFP